MEVGSSFVVSYRSPALATYLFTHAHCTTILHPRLVSRQQLSAPDCHKKNKAQNKATMRAKVFRPHLDDVERLSHGKGVTKQRGTGSKYVCHRLNRDERRFYEHAKQVSFLTVKGTGYRKERKGSPLQNIWRQRCDALAIVYVCIEKHSSEDTELSIFLHFVPTMMLRWLT